MAVIAVAETWASGGGRRAASGEDDATGTTCRTASLYIDWRGFDFDLGFPGLRLMVGFGSWAGWGGGDPDLTRPDLTWLASARRDARRVSALHPGATAH